MPGSEQGDDPEISASGACFALPRPLGSVSETGSINSTAGIAVTAAVGPQFEESAFTAAAPCQSTVPSGPEASVRRLDFLQPSRCVSQNANRRELPPLPAKQRSPPLPPRAKMYRSPADSVRSTRRHRSGGTGDSPKPGHCWRPRENGNSGRYRLTPATAAGVVDRLWKMEDLNERVTV